MNIALTILTICLESYALFVNSGLKEGKLDNDFLAYYTTLSNIVVWLFFVVNLLNICFDICGFIRHPAVVLAVTMAIVLTMLIYGGLLMPAQVRNLKNGTSEWTPFTFVNYCLHFICPSLMLLFWLLCADKSELRLLHGLCWMIFPALYCVYSAIIAHGGHRFADGSRWPYDFMNFDKHGVAKGIMNILVINLLFSLLGLLVAQTGIWMR